MRTVLTALVFAVSVMPAQAQQAPIQRPVAPFDAGTTTTVLSYPAAVCFLPKEAELPAVYSPGAKICQFGRLYFCEGGAWKEDPEVFSTNSHPCRK